MLIWSDNMKNVTEISNTRLNFYEQCKNKLTKAEYDNIVDYVNDLIYNSDKYFVLGWKIPTDWSNTPLSVIYDKCCNTDDVLSAKFLGIITMQCIIDDTQTWYATKSEFNRNIATLVYWKDKN